MNKPDRDRQPGAAAPKRSSQDLAHHELMLEDVARLFGTTSDDIPEDCRELIAKSDFRYRILTGKEHDEIILRVLKTIDSKSLEAVGPHRKQVWEKGWSENFQSFVEKGYDVGELIPKYYRPYQILRINRRYAKAVDPNFEYNFFRVLRLWLFKKYLGSVEFVYEFGCGPGHNLVALAELYSEKKIHGLDWAGASVELLNKVAETSNHNITGHLFDMFSPDDSLKLEGNSLVMTIGGLEQLGDNYESFLQFILRKSPELCLHVEPFCELYDENNLLDYLAIKHHKKRNYFGNYLGSLEQLEVKGEVELLKTQRVFFGGLFEDGWSYVVWRPKKGH